MLRRLEKLQFSIANLLGWAGVCAVLLALSRIDFFCFLIACPFSLGPMAAITVTPTRWSMVLGVVWSLCWLLMSLIPFWVLAAFLIMATVHFDNEDLSRRVLIVVTVTYFCLASAIGGYKGGLAARPDSIR